MKAFLALTFLAALSLAAGFDLKNLKPLDKVVPVNPRYTAQELKEFNSAKVPRPEYNPNFKKGTEPQPEFTRKVHVPTNEQDNRIIGGSPAAAGQFPWHVGIVIDNAYICSGSLISNQFVLTAAHCVYGGSSYRVYLGSTQIESGTQLVSTSSYSHYLYNSNAFSYDIAVILLPSAVNFTPYINPIRLRYIECLCAPDCANVSGWGNNFSTLQHVSLEIITNNECARTYGSVITSTILCAATSNGKSTCNGDNGGPLVYLECDGVYTQIGIVSFFPSAGCQQGLPVGFTRVAAYLGWISEITGIAIP